MKLWRSKLEFMTRASPIVSGLLGALLATACTGDDTSNPAPLTDAAQDRSSLGGSDSGGDATGDVGPDRSATGGAGGGTNDSGSGGVAGTAGAGGAGGAGGSGGGVTDGGGPGGDADANAQPEAEAAAPLTIDQYQNAVAVAYCDRLPECCALTPDRFDRNACIANLSTGFGPDRIFTYLRLYTGDAGRFPSSLSFDANQAAQCVNLQRNRGCISEDGTEKRNLYATCMGAVQGSIPANQSCGTSQECRGGLYCRIGDGGTGTCTAIATLSQPCDDPNRSSDQCTYLGIHSATSLHCSTFATTGGTCVVGLDLGTACQADQQCSSGVCSLLNRTCVISQPNYPGPVTCNLFLKPDAGATEAGGGG